MKQQDKIGSLDEAGESWEGRHEDGEGLGGEKEGEMQEGQRAGQGKKELLSSASSGLGLSHRRT